MTVKKLMTENKLLGPFLKWAGGKRQLLPEIRRLIPLSYKTYFEPFVGAGAVLFDIQPDKAVINDINDELINVYKVVRDNLAELIEDLSKHANSKEYYYQIRDLDKKKERFNNLSSVKKASRIIYLNKTCYNGLFRVNSQGCFNVPFGNYKNPNLFNRMALQAISEYLNSADISIYNTDFEEAVETAGRGDFVYFDPPYDPVSDTASFTGYYLGGFDKNKQIRLKATVDKLTQKGCKVLLSNSATSFIKELYADYKIMPVVAKRPINSAAAKRGSVEEVLVLNYDSNIRISY
ncbi:MAG: Modification methylase DpnIIA [Pelotomaculum sp. PtaB.Bin117]|nr:MAG: Modification methylase DpnIIA [Pelotomaculum sp. PtaB.Bin117]OPY60738.1 MAG: Modification methylase DpnIIA [Pelotomaculum sp. PtaU1.Bin065]